MAERYAVLPVLSPRGYNPIGPMKIAVTGNPGVGKSTLVAQIADRTALPRGGMITAEIRKCGRRVGVSLRDLTTGKEGVLAHRHLSDGPAFGPYRLNLHDLDLIGVAAIERAIRDAQLVIIDEVGPMELRSARFIHAVQRALDEAPNLLVTVHRKSNHALTYAIRHRADHLVRLTRQSRDGALVEILRWLSERPATTTAV